MLLWDDNETLSTSYIPMQKKLALQHVLDFSNLH
jgi:hypothetical protein